MFDTILQDIPHRTIQCKSRDVLLAAGDTANSIFLIKSGCARAWYNAEGRDITLQFFMSGQPVASFESLANRTASEYTLEVVVPSEIVVIRGEDFREWIEAHPERHFDGIRFAMNRMASYQSLFLSRIKDTPQQRYED